MKKKSAGIIFIGILATAFFGCSKFKVGSFVMPSWNTQLSAPIFDRTYTLGEILYKDSIVVSNGDTTFITPLGPASEFTLFSAKPTNGTTFAGKLTLGADSASYSVIDPSILVGQSAPVPPMPAHSATLMPALPFGNFDYASVASGILRITVKNECPASLLFQNGIDVVDSSNGQWIFNIPIPGDSLAPNQSYTVSKSLAGIVIPNDPELRFTYSSPGSASPQTYSTDTLLTVSFTSSDIIASSVSGAVHLKDPVAIPSDTVSFNLGDFGKEFSGPATFGDSTKLTLNFNLTDGFPLLMHLSVVPSSKSVVDPSPDSAVVEEMIYPGQSNSVCFGPDLVSALNKYSASYQRIPDEFIFSGYVIVNPGPPYANGTISENDKVDGTGIVSVPFDVGIASAVIADTTKSHGELAPAISDSATASKLANVDSGQVVIEVNNGLPVRFSISTQLIDTLTHQVVATFPQDSVVIPAANDFNSDGTVRSPMFSRNVITIGHQLAVDLGRCYMKYNISVLTSPNQRTVMFTKNNTISLRVYANLSLMVDKNLVGK